MQCALEAGHFDRAISAATCAAQTSYVLHNEIPAACFTNSVERLVAASVFVRNFSFNFTRESDAARMTAWLEQFGNRHGLCSVTNMRLTYVPSNRYHGLFQRIQLVRHCPGLRDLTVSIPLTELSDVALVIQYQFHLRRLLDCGQLRKVTFVISSRHAFQYVSTRPQTVAMKSLARKITIRFHVKYRRELVVKVDVSDNKGRILGHIL